MHAALTRNPDEPAAGRALIRDLFLRFLGLTFLVAFLSLLVQVDVLFGSRGLLPVRQYLEAIRASATPFTTPTIFWLSSSDTALRTVAIAGALLSVGLILNLAPRYCLIVLWALYLSFVTVGQAFLGFQWDNLLLESAFFALFVTPGGLRPRRAPSPHPIAIFLMLWLVFRLHVESGAAKLLTGDPTWRNLTAMVNYYETAPIPTWLGWYAHQMPIGAQKLSALFTFVVELGVPLVMWWPRKFRATVFLAMIAMQVSVILTANYGFFNYLTIALCLFVLDDGHLQWVARRIGWRLAARQPGRSGIGRTLLLTGISAPLVVLSIILFLPFFHSFRDLNRALAPVRHTPLARFRSLNTYHLFAHMTLVRREVVIEGSNDGSHWLAYEFKYKPGDPNRPPPFVAPYQPRVDFQLWFLLLGGPPRARYFGTLLARLFHAPDVVAPLFSRNPFPEKPPRFIRLAFYRYRFTDFATRRATGAWWRRKLLGYSKVLTAASFRR
ncbi:MAG: lipase maturation factor family protein [Candidatus Binatia bacterium]